MACSGHSMEVNRLAWGLTSHSDFDSSDTGVMLVTTKREHQMNLINSPRTGLLLIVALGLAVNGHSQSFLTNGIVAYYPLNGNTDDASGNGRSLTNSGATLTTD